MSDDTELTLDQTAAERMTQDEYAARMRAYAEQEAEHVERMKCFKADLELMQLRIREMQHAERFRDAMQTNDGEKLLLMSEHLRVLREQTQHLRDIAQAARALASIPSGDMRLMAAAPALFRELACVLKSFQDEPTIGSVEATRIRAEWQQRALETLKAATAGGEEQIVRLDGEQS